MALPRALLLVLLAGWIGLAAGPAGAWGWFEAAPSAEVGLAQLPPEARQTLALIKQGGPFPHAKDGTIFKNREGRLPARARGYYREYTVPTPGARDRGARRIVAGQSGERYYTGDHYRTFQRIRE